MTTTLLPLRIGGKTGVAQGAPNPIAHFSFDRGALAALRNTALPEYDRRA
ncbi:hypothetical protein M2360_002438 [Rhizobium sp. SG_E_25_P2]|nr:hypothetical protein [Rhizobium sp. SG_E_25_P2]MDH6267041.1 hypothetical protein [Rhizobium sp. SG_E_25_P2]